MKFLLNTTMIIALLAAGGLAFADEGFENPTTIFTISNHNVSHVVNDASQAHTGSSSFRVNPSSCGASCFDSYRVDLTHTFEKTVHLIGVGICALEASSSGSGWGGKIRVGHDSTWNLFDSGYDWWGVIGNNKPITGQWYYEFVSIRETATNVKIRLWDITNRSTLWIDDVVLYYVMDGVVMTEQASWGSVKAIYLD